MKKIQKRILLGILIVLGYLLLLSNPVQAANNINRIEMDVLVSKDGTAHITETWNASLNSGTEGYKPYGNLGDSQIKNFTVKDGNGKQYTTLDFWSTDKTFQEKAYKAGIHKTSRTTELCWGISQYGTNTYILNYDITNFVKQYQDSQVIYFGLIPKEMEQSPGSVKITIHAEETLSVENSNIWAFGYPRGDIQFLEGTIVMDSKGRLPASDYMVCLIKVKDGIFTPTRTIYRNFDDVYQEAMKDVKKDENEKKETRKNGGIMVVSTIVIMIVSMLPFVFWFAILYAILKCCGRASGKYETGEKIKEKEQPYYRDIPCKKDLLRAYWIGMQYGLIYEKSGVMGAILLKWIKEGKVGITKTKDGLFNLKDNNYAIDFTNPYFETENEMERRLSYLLKAASGNNQILESKEFEKYCKVHYEDIEAWFRSVTKYEESLLEKEGLIEKKKIEKKFLGIIPYQTTKKVLSNQLREEAVQLAGLKRYLLDYSQIEKREAIEVHLWEEYLIFAQLLGIADKVEEQFSKLYPSYNEISRINTHTTCMATRTMMYSGYTAAHRAYTASRASSSSSSSSYSSGSGGSSHSGGGSSSSGHSSGGGFR